MVWWIYIILGEVNYTNWRKGHVARFNQTDCVFMELSGKWNYESKNCPNINICPVCLIKNTPVMTLKGLVTLSPFWDIRTTD